MKKLAGIIVIVALVIGLKMWNRGSSDKQVLADTKQLLGHLDVTAEERTYLEGALDRVHAKAFDAAYSLGGRRRGAKLDEKKYLDQVFGALFRECRDNGKAELADKVGHMHNALMKADTEKP